VFGKAHVGTPNLSRTESSEDTRTVRCCARGTGSVCTHARGAAGIGYAFRWGEIIFDYRYLHYNQSGDKMIDSISLGGFALGANFRF